MPHNLSANLKVPCRKVFPDAKTREEITILAPPQARGNIRFWSFYGKILTIPSMAILAIEVYAYGESDPHVILIPWPSVNIFLCIVLAAGMTMLQIGRRNVGRKKYKFKKMPWEEWGSSRGLTPTTHERLISSGLDLFVRGHTRKWDGIHEGRIRYETFSAHAIVGETSYATGSGKTKQTHHLYFVCLKLPKEIVNVFPGTRFTRFLDGIATDMNDASGEMSELRLESIIVDDSCKIMVEGDPNAPVWRELFDPVTIDALRTRFDIQWNQMGKYVVFASHPSIWERILGARWITSVPAEKMDTLCAGAAFMFSRMLHAAKGDVSTKFLDAAAKS